MILFAIIIYLPPKEKKQLYFNLVLIYTDNKVKSKEGKRSNGFAIIFLFTSNINLWLDYFFSFRGENMLSQYI